MTLSTELVLYVLLLAIGVVDIITAPASKRYYLLGSNVSAHLAISTVLAVSIPDDLLISSILGVGTLLLFGTVLFGVRYWEHWPEPHQRSKDLKTPLYKRELTFLFVLAAAANTFALATASPSKFAFLFWALVLMIALLGALFLLGFVARWTQARTKRHV